MLINSFKNLFFNKKFCSFYSKNFLIIRDCEKNNYLEFDSNNFKNKNFYKFSRFYVTISNSLVYYEIIKIPNKLAVTQKFSFAKLEALRIFNLLNPKKDKFSFSFYEISNDEILVSIVPRKILLEIKNKFKSFLISGIFPSWVSLYSFLYSSKSDIDPNALYYVSHRDGYEGFWLRNGKIKGIIPSLPDTAKSFIDQYNGPIKKLSFDSLLDGACIVSPDFFSDNVPCFEEFSFLSPPRISLKIIPLWLLPLFIYLVSQYILFLDSNLSSTLSQLDKKLLLLRKDLSRIENVQQEVELKKKLSKIVSSYLSDKRVSVASTLLEMTLSLPSDAWIRRFEFRSPNEVRIWGEADNALHVLELLAQNKIFYDVKFLTTVRKNISKNKEMFAISLKIRFSS